MKKSYFSWFYSLSIISVMFCQSCDYEDDKCHFENIRRMYVVPTVYNDRDTDYTHFVLLHDYSRKCLDSLTIINIAYRYIDTLTEAKPATLINFFSSDSDFEPGETSQVSKVDKSCLVKIWFDRRTKKPTGFVFYNGKGDITYCGKKWKPNDTKNEGICEY